MARGSRPRDGRAVQDKAAKAGKKCSTIVKVYTYVPAFPRSASASAWELPSPSPTETSKCRVDSDKQCAAQCTAGPRERKQRKGRYLGRHIVWGANERRGIERPWPISADLPGAWVPPSLPPRPSPSPSHVPAQVQAPPTNNQQGGRRAHRAAQSQKAVGSSGTDVPGRWPRGTYHLR